MVGSTSPSISAVEPLLSARALTFGRYFRISIAARYASSSLRRNPAGAVVDDIADHSCTDAGVTRDIGPRRGTEPPIGWVSGHGASSVQLRGVNLASRPSPRCLASLSIGCRRISGADQSLTSTISSSVLSGRAGTAVLQRSIANLQARCWPAFPCPPRDVRCVRRSPSAQILSNPIAGLSAQIWP